MELIMEIAQGNTMSIESEETWGVCWGKLVLRQQKRTEGGRERKMVVGSAGGPTTY